MSNWIPCPECSGLGALWEEQRTDAPRQAVIEGVMAKTLGQVAYGAYRDNEMQGPRNHDLRAMFDTWNDLWPDHQQSWQAAAEAVVREYVKSRREEVFVPEDGPEALQEVE